VTGGVFTDLDAERLVPRGSRLGGGGVFTSWRMGYGSTLRARNKSQGVWTLGEQLEIDKLKRH
jgi:hypothetical protein